jgi:ribosome-binding ATPase YchF (GTP1/OBG family)
MAFKDHQFKKGEGGRKKGAVNIVTRELKETIKSFVEKNWSKVQKDFDSLSPLDRIEIIIKMSSLVIPRRVSADVELTQIDAPDYSKMTDKELEDLKHLLGKTTGEEIPEIPYATVLQEQKEERANREPVRLTEEMLEPEPAAIPQARIKPSSVMGPR